MIIIVTSVRVSDSLVVFTPSVVSNVPNPTSSLFSHYLGFRLSLGINCMQFNYILRLRIEINIFNFNPQPSNQNYNVTIEK